MGSWGGKMMKYVVSKVVRKVRYSKVAKVGI